MSSWQDKIERAVVVALGRAPRPLQRLIAGDPPVTQGEALHPEVGAALRVLGAMRRDGP